MKTLLILCLALVGLIGFSATEANAATAVPITASAPATLPVAVHQNYTEIRIGGGGGSYRRHSYRRYHRYHRRNYYWRHHRRIYY